MKNKLLLCGIAALFTAYGCGSGNSDNGAAGLINSNATDGTQSFQARLSPLNAEQLGHQNASGTLMWNRDGDNVSVDLSATGLAPDMAHRVHILRGTSCPTLADNDANQDGWLDVSEGLPAHGAILIPVDSDLVNLDLANGDDAAMAGGDGAINFQTSASFDALSNSLHDTENAPDIEGVERLAEGEEFMPGEAVVVVHGVANSAQIPDSVESVGGLSAQETIPVLCGQLEQVSSGDNGGSGENGNGEDVEEEGADDQPMEGDGSQGQGQQQGQEQGKQQQKQGKVEEKGKEQGQQKDQSKGQEQGKQSEKGKGMGQEQGQNQDSEQNE